MRTFFEIVIFIVPILIFLFLIDYTEKIEHENKKKPYYKDITIHKWCKYLFLISIFFIIISFIYFSII